MSNMFDPGVVMVTQPIMARMKENSRFEFAVRNAFSRLCAADWGNLSDYDKAANDRAAKSDLCEDRVLAKYTALNSEIYIVTDIVDDVRVSTVMFVDEY